MRVTQKMLQDKINVLNEITDSPMEYSTDKVINGGWELQRVMNTSGGVDTPLGHTGHIPKKELYYLIDAYIRGISLMSEDV